MHTLIHRIQTYLFLPIVVLIGGALVAVLLIIGKMGQDEVDTLRASKREGFTHLYRLALESEKQLLEGLMFTLEQDETLVEPYLGGDREGLQALGLPILSQLKSRFGTTHLYFHQPDGINFLRVHNPILFGDQIDRPTTLEAMLTGRLASGVEIGASGVATLRVVAPWRVHGKLLGYLELGKEMGHITPRLAEMMQASVAVYLRKSALSRQQWETGRSQNLLPRALDWNTFATLALSDVAGVGISPTVLGQVGEELMAGQRAFNDQEGLGNTGGDLDGFLVPIIDSRQDIIGTILVAYDVGPLHQSVKDRQVALGGAGILLGLLVVAGFYGTTRYLQRTLDRAYQALQTEIQQRERVETRLRFQAQILNQMKDTVIQLDQDCRIVLWNEGASRMLGYPAASLLGRTPEVLSPQLQPPLVVGDYELRVSRADEGLISVMASVSALSDAAGGAAGWLLYLMDLSEHKENEALLVDAQEAAEQGSAAKSAFLSNMSHELRTPLNAILGFSQLLEMQAGLDPEAREYSSIILEAGQNLTRMVDDLLRMAEVDSQKVSLLHLEAVYLAPLVTAAYQRCCTMTEAGQVTVHIHGESLEGVCIQGDPVRLGLLFENLLSNAIKYNKPGGQVHVAGQGGSGGRFCIWVRDTGVGIAPENLYRIFEKFNRLTTAGGSIHGAGVGLALGKFAVERMDGRLWAESRLGEGSCFYCELPLTPLG